MGPIWGRQDSGGPHGGPMNFAIWVLYCLLELFFILHSQGVHAIWAIETASQITGITIVYSTVFSGADQRKHKCSASLAFVREFSGDRWIPCTKGRQRGKCFHLMTSSWIYTVCCYFQEEETFDRRLNDLGFKHVVRVTDLKYVTDNANIDHHNKVVQCSAKLPKLPVKTANATIQVECKCLDPCNAL